MQVRTLIIPNIEISAMISSHERRMDGRTDGRTVVKRSSPTDSLVEEEDYMNTTTTPSSIQESNEAASDHGHAFDVDSNDAVLFTNVDDNLMENRSKSRRKETKPTMSEDREERRDFKESRGEEKTLDYWKRKALRAEKELQLTKVRNRSNHTILPRMSMTV